MPRTHYNLIFTHVSGCELPMYLVAAATLWGAGDLDVGAGAQAS